MGKQVSAVTGSMRLYSTRPNARIGSSSSLASNYFLNRAVIIIKSNNNSNYITSNKSTSLLKNGIIYGIQPFVSYSYINIS